MNRLNPRALVLAALATTLATAVLADVTIGVTVSATGPGAALGAAHVVVLNKFPVIDRHLLLVTRQFEDQHTPLSHADFDALAAVIAVHGGLGFYNGGRTAGASQAHKHLQWVPETAATLEASQKTAGELAAAQKADLARWEKPIKATGVQLD